MGYLGKLCKKTDLEASALVFRAVSFNIFFVVVFGYFVCFSVTYGDNF